MMYEIAGKVHTDKKRKESINMPSKKKIPVRLEDLTPDEKVKYEIAEELGLLDRVMKDGWKSLTSKETGRIGGLITKKKRQNDKNDKNITNVN